MQGGEVLLEFVKVLKEEESRRYLYTISEVSQRGKCESGDAKRLVK